ncbi:MAG: hypothetical protein HONBIEJF_02266 [Fimbriimonadaceae bacterium]|nr:hypothetical protein [Fimbriimonadaceae bacterium]
MTVNFDALWNYDDPAGTESAFRELLPQLEGDKRLELQTQIARTLGLQQKFEEAHELLDAIEPACLAAEGRTLARWHLEKGRTLRSSNRQAEALPHFEAAQRIADHSGEEGLEVDALHMLAIADEPARRMSWHLAAIERAESSEDPDARRWLGSLLNNLGWTYHDEGRLDEALQCFEKALQARHEQGKEGPIRVARWTVARCLRSLGRHQDALDAQLALWHGDATDGYVAEEIGENLLALDRRTEAVPYFAQAYEQLKDDIWLQRDESDRLKRLQQLGVITGVASG